MKHFAKLSLSLVALAAALPAAALADEQYGPQPQEEALAAASAASEVYGPAMPSQGEMEMAANAVSDSELDDARGAYAPALQYSTAEAALNNNNLSNASSGTNGVSNSFNGFNGIAVNVQNSGNGVIIQSSFQVNVNFH